MKKIIIGIIIVFGLIVCSFFGLKVYAEKLFVNSINRIEQDRDEMMGILKKNSDLQNQAFAKMDSLKLFTDEKVSYDTRVSILKQIQAEMDESFQLDNELLANSELQVKNLNNIQKLYFFLNKDNRSIFTDVKQSLDRDLKNTKSLVDINKQEAYLVINLLKVNVDLTLLSDINQQKNISDALSMAVPFQKYTSSGFVFENEELYRKDYPQPYGALSNAKKYFEDYYNYLLAVNSGDEQKSLSLGNSLSSKGEVMLASMQNSFDYSNPKWKDIYQSEISSSGKYIQSVDEFKKVNFNAPREKAYYILLNIEKEYHNTDKYPKATNFQELKSKLNLKYGSQDYIKYSSSGESSYTLKYLDKTSNQWIKFESKI